ncbi:MAG: hypothetical protein Q9226_008224 [Calogaya cf. arnoldii]
MGAVVSRVWSQHRVIHRDVPRLRRLESTLDVATTAKELPRWARGDQAFAEECGSDVSAWV